MAFDLRDILKMKGIILLVFTGALVYLVHKLFSFVKALQAIQYHPGKRLLLSPMGALGGSLPPIPWVSFGSNTLFNEKHQPYKSIGWDIYSTVTLYPNVSTMMCIADAAAIKEVVLSRARFPKPIAMYDAILTTFGHNIIVSEGEEWKKYRKISAPAFSDRNNELVWDESVKTMQGLFNELWANQDVISMNHVVDITLQITLFIIGVAGFGKSVSWKKDGAVIPPGHKMTYNDALHITSNNFILKVAVPGWALSLTPRLRKVKLAFEELQTYLLEMIRERRAVVDKVERHDLFTSLIEANDHELETLSEDELISNIHVFFLAGHETTAHTLGFAFALLALYPDEQEKVFEQIKSVIEGRVPTYKEMPLLTYSSSVIYETLRMFPPVPGIPKVAAEDATLVASNIHGEKKAIPILKGTEILLDVAGIHFNPRYWDDPHAFNPSRFLKDWPRDAYFPFSVGARACIGRKFAETSSTAVLAMLVSRYKITIKEEPQFVGESFEERKSRVLSSRRTVSLTYVSK